MAIAWATIAILVLLLPGFMFFTGFYSPRRFSRDTTPRSAVGQLAAIVLVSFSVHTLLFWVNWLSAWLFPAIPAVDLRLVLSTLQAGTAGAASVSEISTNLSEHFVAIPIYIGMSVLAGFGVGFGIAKGAVGGPFGFLLEHAWVYELIPPGSRVATTYAHILTNVQDDERVLLYRGPLYQFGLHQDGRFAYLVLRRAERFYLELKPDKPETSAAKALVIGATRTKGDVSQLARSREIDFLYVEGREIANVVFERFTLDSPDDLSQAKAVIQRAAEGPKAPTPA